MNRCRECEKLTVEGDQVRTYARCWSEEAPTGPGRVLTIALPEAGEKIREYIVTPKWCHKK